MRPAVKKKPPAKKAKPLLSAETAKELLKMRRWVEQALYEVKTAREYMASQYAGPEHESLSWAQQFLENALTGKAAGR